MRAYAARGRTLSFGCLDFYNDQRIEERGHDHVHPVRRHSLMTGHGLLCNITGSRTLNDDYPFASIGERGSVGFNGRVLRETNSARYAARKTVSPEWSPRKGAC